MAEFRDNMAKLTKVLIIGGGNGGISMAARLRKRLGPGAVTIVEPSDTHYYQPLWTLVGAGVVPKEKTQRAQKTLIPDGVDWVQERVMEINPALNTVRTDSGAEILYEILLVATGLKLDFHKIKGLEGNLGRNGLCSIYDFQQAEKTHQMLEDFNGGHAIFTMPPVPIKCAGAPQKIMYLADEIFSKNNVRSKTKITFGVAGKVIFGVPSFAAALLKVVEQKKIDVWFSHRLVEVDPKSKTATFEKTSEVTEDGQIQVTKELITSKYDLLHVVPPMSAHDFVQSSGLAHTEGAQSGWLNVNKNTLQHPNFRNVFGIGDVTGVPNSKTGAAIRKQAPVVEKNICDFIAGRPLSGIYDGYSSCPLITGFGKVILAEFGYDNKLMPTFPMDMTQERKSMWHLKKDLLPVMYWHGIMKGRM